MKKMMLAFAILFQASFAFAQTLSADLLQRDLTFLQEAIYRGHPDVFRYTTKDSFDAFFNQIRESVKAVSTPNEAYFPINQCLSKIGCGHTVAYPLPVNDSALVLPIRFAFAENKIVVLENLSDDSTIQVGSEILSINGHPISEIWENLRDQRPSDGFNQTFKEVLFTRSFMSQFETIYGKTKTYYLIIRNQTGESTQYKIKAITYKERTARIKEIKINYALILKQKSAILYFAKENSTVGVFKISDFNGKSSFYKTVFDTLEKRKTENLIIDLRGNLGGDITNMAKLLSYLLNEKFGYTMARNRFNMGKYNTFGSKLMRLMIFLKHDTGLYKKHKEGNRNIYEINENSSKLHHFQGKIFVLTDAFTFSAASMCASFLKNKGHATVVGTETSGGEASNNGRGGFKIELPNSKIVVNIPNFHLDYGLIKDNGRGVIPNYETPQTVANIIARKDLAMEKVLELIRNK